MTTTIYTVGHSNQSLQTFIALLQKVEINRIVDVRTSPISRYCPYFSKPYIKTALINVDIQYDYQGKKLGGMLTPKEKGTLAVQSMRKQCLVEITKLAESEKIALMCAEKDPTNCHRFHELTPILASLGVNVMHIMSDGTLKSDIEFRQALDNNFKSYQLWDTV